MGASASHFQRWNHLYNSRADPVTPLPALVGAGEKDEASSEAQKEGGKQAEKPSEGDATPSTPEESPFDGADSLATGATVPAIPALTSGTESWAFSLQDPASSLAAEKEHAAATGAALAGAYLKFNQAAYAVAALPIGTVLSIAPLYLKDVMKVQVNIIGYLMMGGELLGIVFMKYAERSKRGFLVSRPHDLNLNLLSVATCLGLLPLWPRKWWYVSAGFMMLVQAFNSASKPIVAEAVHRLALMAQKPPSTAYAQCNNWRRIGNAIVGATAPLLYKVEPGLMFFLVGPALLAFALVHICFIRRVAREVQASDISLQHSPAAIRRTSTVTSIHNLLDETTTSKRLSAMARRSRSSNGSGALPMLTGSRGSRVLQLLVVHAFPNMDAWISRLPFAFMAIAIAEDSGAVVACVVLLFYQSARSVSQSIQTCYIGNASNYLLTSVSIVAYAVVLAMVLTKAGSAFWYVPVVLTGLSETLPVQQYYLNYIVENRGDIIGEAVRDRMLRELVKQSHTGTGIGSALAFLTSSQIYHYYDLAGVAILGLGVALLKLLNIVIIGLNIP